MSVQFGHLARKAEEVLRANDTGRIIKASPTLYPHQWSWDAGFVAVGMANVDPERALQEMRSLFSGQWKNGLIPHIVFNPDVDEDAYFPGPARWDVRRISTDAPEEVATSGIIQPPVHALAIREAIEQFPREEQFALADVWFDRLFRWHQYLMTARDPETSGLITIVHPWESGMDNSPRWDDALARVVVPEGELPPYTRRDLQHVEDPFQRPTNADYDRFMWLVEVLKENKYDVTSIYSQLPFRMKDVFASAIFVQANEALMWLAQLADADIDDLTIIESWIDRGRDGLRRQFDDESGMCLDRDLVSGKSARVSTIAGFAGVVAGGLTGEARTQLKALWGSAAFVGNGAVQYPLPPSTAFDDPGFVRTRYWRGPTWPVINWLLWRSWRKMGETDLAEALRAASLAQIESSGFAEYMDPVSGAALGSDNQSWTAAAVLDWCAEH